MPMQTRQSGWQALEYTALKEGQRQLLMVIQIGMPRLEVATHLAAGDPSFRTLQRVHEWTRKSVSAPERRGIRGKMQYVRL